MTLRRGDFIAQEYVCISSEILSLHAPPQQQASLDNENRLVSALSTSCPTQATERVGVCCVVGCLLQPVQLQTTLLILLSVCAGALCMYMCVCVCVCTTGDKRATPALLIAPSDHRPPRDPREPTFRVPQETTQFQIWGCLCMRGKGLA